MSISASVTWPTPRPPLRGAGAGRAGPHRTHRRRRAAPAARPERARLADPSERRVAQLAAVGLSNRDIAQNLFITARTVEEHLTHAYQKLAITSREQLPAALAPPGGEATAQAFR